LIKEQKGNFVIIQQRDRSVLWRKINSNASMRISIFLVYFAHCFRYVYGLILIPFYGRILGVEEYGRLLVAMALYQIVWLVIEYGCPFNGVRDLAVTEDKNLIGKIFGQQFIARIYLLPIGVAIGFATIWLSPALLSAPQFGIWALALAIVSAFHIGWYFQGTFQYISQALIELVSFILSLGLILSLVHGEHDGALVIKCLFAVSATCIATSYLIAIRKFGIRRIHFGGGFTLIRNSTALFASRGLKVAMMHSFPYLLSLIATASEVGYYGAAEKIVLAGISFMQPIGQILIGKITKGLASEKTETDSYLLMRKGIIALILFGCLATFVVTLLSPYLVPIVLGKAFSNSISIMQWLGLIFPFAAFNQAITSYVLIPLKKDHYVVKNSVINIFFSIVGIIYFTVFDEINGLSFARIRVFAEVISVLFLLCILIRLNLLRKIFWVNDVRGCYEC
jgi:O-antigen/teichoic acid export membrane protein